MFTIQAIAQIPGSSLNGEAVILWTGKTKHAARKTLARLEVDLRAHYHSFVILPSST